MQVNYSVLHCIDAKRIMLTNLLESFAPEDIQRGQTVFVVELHIVVVVEL